MLEHWLKAIKKGEAVDEHWRLLTQGLARRPRRRFYVRALLSMARAQPDPNGSGSFAERAGDVLFAFLKRPALARAAYAYAAARLRDPESVQLAIQEIDERTQRSDAKQNDPVSDQLIEMMAHATSLPSESKQPLRIQAGDLLLKDRPSFDLFKGRVNALLPWLCEDELLRDEALSALRDRERYDFIIHALQACLLHVQGEARRRILLELGHAFRFGRGDLMGAAACFEELVQLDSSDRESWGELLECLDDHGDDEALVSALERRIQHASGLEQRELIRQRELVLERQEQNGAPIAAPSPLSAN